MHSLEESYRKLGKHKTTLQNVFHHHLDIFNFFNQLVKAYEYAKFSVANDPV